VTAEGGAPDVSIVLPIHNQAEHVEHIVESYVAELDRQPKRVEIVLVANGCTDGSERICHELAERHERIQVIELPEGGWGRSVKAGLRAARGEVLCYTNSARTTPQMLSLALIYSHAYPDVVVKANRKIRDNWRRRLGSLIYNLQCRALFDLPTWDINGTPKVFPRRFARLLELSSDDDLIDVEFIVRCRDAGYPVVEVPILATVRHGGRSTTNYASALRLYLGAYRLSRR
jgi:glycosyltransferase involved in cell wall biosynthesis